MADDPKVVENDENKVYNSYQSGRSWLIASLGLIITVVAIALIFFISSMEGTRIVQAGNRTSGKILEIWRLEEGIEDGFPEPKVTIVVFEDREYFYIEEYDENGNVEDWYFAFEGGLQYVFNDYKYYVLTAIVSAIAIFVIYINYTSSVQNAKGSKKFGSTLMFYKDAKTKVSGFFQLLPMFCIDKNKETRDIEVRNIVEEAGLFYEDYMKKKINLKNLEKWQKKILKKIPKVKIEVLRSTDLIQEKSKGGNTIRMLPMGEQEHQKSYLIKTSINKVVTISLSGVVVAFGVVLGNWTLGATYGFTVALGAVTASIAGTEYVYNTLKNRYISKANYLIEFDSVKEKYIEKDRLGNMETFYDFKIKKNVV